MTSHQLEQMLLVAIIENSEEQHTQAQEYATLHNFTQDQITSACNKVTSFLRFHGVSNLLPNEQQALVKLQSFLRMCIIQIRLRKEMQYWHRLAIIDNMEHIKKAEKIFKVINSFRRANTFR